MQSIGHPTNLAVVAEHILTGLLEVCESSHGALYLLEHDHERYRHVRSRGQLDTMSAPSVVALSDPLVQTLVQCHQILAPANPASTSLVYMEPAMSTLLGTFPANLAIPLVTQGRMIAFIVVHSQIEAGLNSLNKELLLAMVQSAANALDSLMIYEDLRQSQTLMRRADRLRSLEIMPAVLHTRSEIHSLRSRPSSNWLPNGRTIVSSLESSANGAR
ncbi:MAG: GAF domain-containing protein [Nitrospira sp.]|nr:GAF domain-containing protein [Nitrospira sp.]